MVLSVHPSIVGLVSAWGVWMLLLSGIVLIAVQMEGVSRRRVIAALLFASVLVGAGLSADTYLLNQCANVESWALWILLGCWAL